jgi:putative transposase
MFQPKMGIAICNSADQSRFLLDLLIFFMSMARLPRVVITGVPHHVTQRGNAQQVIFTRQADRAAYLDLLQHYAGLYGLTLLGYCLMSNHVHLISVPQGADSLAQALKHAHGRYAAYWNARHCSSGHVWQGRFYSCPLDERHLWMGLRYVELNPVRAGMVAVPEQWPWSSASAHCDVTSAVPWLEMERWRKRWSAAEWKQYLGSAEACSDVSALRQFTHSGRPLGSEEFVAGLEQSTARSLAPRRAGRRKVSKGELQLEIPLVA